MKAATRLQLLALACALGSAPALADVQGQARLGNLRFTLFDLAPGDAVTPSLAWGVPHDPARPRWTGGVSIGYESYGADGSWGESDSHYVDATPGGPATVEHAPGTHASISAAYAHPTPLGQLLSLSLRNAPLPDANTRMVGDVYGEQLLFTLSPHTRVSLSIDLSAGADTRPLRSHDEFLRFSAGLSVIDYLDYAGLDTDSLVLETGTLPDMASGFDGTRSLTVDFSNDSGAARYASLSFSLASEAWATPLSAVPEPSSHAMLLAGAALFGWRRTRVQRRIDRPMVKATSGVRLLSPRENIASSCTSFDRR